MLFHIDRGLRKWEIIQGTNSRKASPIYRCQFILTGVNENRTKYKGQTVGIPECARTIIHQMPFHERG